MRRLLRVLTLLCCVLFLLLPIASAEVYTKGAINEDYFKIGGKPWVEADAKTEIILGVVYLGNYADPHTMELPNGLQLKHLQKVYAQGHEAYLLVPKFSGTGLVVSKVEQIKLGKRTIKEVTDIFTETIDEPVLIFCNDQNQPYDVQITITRDGVAAQTKFFLHLNGIRLLPMVPAGVKDFTAFVKTNYQ